MVSLPPELVPVREFQSADGASQVVIFRRPDGSFGFAAEQRQEIDGMIVWSPFGPSGIYESFDAAQRAALAEAPWLFDPDSE